MSNEFKVIVGQNGYKIVDSLMVTYGSYSSEEDATHYCDMLNLKWEQATVRL